MDADAAAEAAADDDEKEEEKEEEEEGFAAGEVFIAGGDMSAVVMG